MEKKIINVDTGKTLVTKLIRADSFWTRLRGLLPYTSLPEGQGMLLTPCSSVHTFFMKFDIDVLYLDQYYRIVRAYETVKPWKVLIPARKAQHVLELPAGMIAATQTVICQRVAFIDTEESNKRRK